MRIVGPPAHHPRVSDDLRTSLVELLAAWDEVAAADPADYAAGYAAGISDAATELRGVLWAFGLPTARRVPVMV